VELDDSQKSAVHDKVARMIGATPILSYQIDPSLIGGLVIQVGDDLYDASIRTKLALLKSRLIAGQARALIETQNQAS
jgi:F-type H+-transporting ATPase subunit delta